MVWSKKRIMTVYLNVIEFGDGIYGAEAAARHYYKKSAKDLTREQAAMLAAVLPNPLKYKVKNPSRYILRRQQWILDQMRMWGNRLDLDNPNTPGIPKNK
jgi:monofunctional biosynthetic peptidoglycan transglycosylase